MNMKTMYKTGVKRVLAFALTLCMLIGIMPAGVITAPSGIKAQAASEYDMYFNMLKAKNGTNVASSKEKIKTITYEETTIGDAAEMNKDVADTDPWQTLDVFPATPQTGNTYVAFTSASPAYMLLCGYHHKDLPVGIRFRIKAKETGYYLPYANFERNSAGTKASTTVYKYDATATGGLGEKIVATTLIDMGKDANNATTATVTGTPVKLEKGAEYVVELAATQLTYNHYSNQIKFKGYGFRYMGATDTTLNLSAVVDSPVNVGSVKKVPLTIAAKDGSAVDYNNLSVEVSYSDKQIASVAISANAAKTAATLDITGVNFGSTKAKVIVKAGNYSGELELNIAVRNATEPVGTNLHYSLLKGCTAHFHQLFPDNVADVSYDMTTVNSTTEINPEITAPNGTAMTPWAYFSQTRDKSNVNNVMKYSYSAVSSHKTYSAKYGGIAMYASTFPFSLDLKIQVPTSGWYNMSVGALSAAGKKFTVGVYEYDALKGTKGNAVVAATTIAPTVTGSIATFGVNQKPFELEAGEYIVEIAIIEASGYTYLQNIDLEFVGGDAPLLNIEGDLSQTVTVGQSVTIPLTLSRSNESAVDYSNITADFSYTDAGIVTAEVVKSGSEAAIKLTANSFGSTEVTVSMKDGQFAGTKSFRVAARYADGSEPAGKNLYYNIFKGYDGNTTNDYPKTITYNKTTVGATGELNTSMTSDPWAYFDRTPSAQSGNTVSKYYGSSYGINCLTYTQGHLPVTVQLKLQVPTSGYYMPYVDIHPAYSGAVSTSSLYKYDAIANTKGAAIIDPIDFNSSTGAEKTVILSDVPVMLEAGEYIMVFGASAASETKVGSIINGYGLTYIGNKAVVFKAEPESATATIVANKSLDMPVSITYTEDGVPVEFDYTNAEVSFAYSADGIVEATANKTASGISMNVTGKSLGTATVTATVSVGTWKSSFNVLVTVDDGKAKDLYYNMYKVVTTASREQSEFIDTVRYHHTTAGSASEMNAGSFTSSPWEFLSKKVASGGYIRFNGYGYGLYFYRQGTLDLKIKVGASGYYKAEALFDYGNSLYKNMKATLYRYDSSKGEIGAAIADSGNVNTNGDDSKKLRIWAPLGDEALWLEEGEYVLRVIQGDTGSNTRGAFEGFSLKAVKLMPEAPASIEIGKSVEIPVFRGAKLACDSLSATVGSNDIATVGVDKSTGVVTLTGVAAGETTLTVTCEGDMAGSYTVPVKVINPEKPAAKSVYFDFAKANTFVDKYVEASAVDNYSLTVQGSTGEIGKGTQNSFNANAGAWKYHSWGKDYYQSTKFGYAAAGQGLYTYRKVHLMVKVAVPETGMYQIISKHNKASKANVKFTLYEVTASGSLTRPTELGTINTSSSQLETAFPAVLELKAGEYVVNMEVLDDDKAGIIDGILFKAPDVVSYAKDAAVVRGTSKLHPINIESDVAVVRANVSLSGDVAEVTPIIDNGKLNLQISGNTNGDMIVTYEAYLADGKFGVGSFAIFVNPAGVVVAEDLRFDYHKLNIYLQNGESDDKHKGVDITRITDFSMTTKGSADEINPNSTIITEPWHYVSDTGTQLRYASYDYGMIFDYEPAEMVFKIRVKEDGLYRPFSEHMVYNSGAKVKVWLAPDNASNTKADEYYLGEFDTYSDATQQKYQQGLKIVDLTAGDYVLTYKMEGKNEAVRSSGRFGVGAFILKGMNSRTVLTASVDGADMLPVGVEKDFVVSAFETNGLTGDIASIDVALSMTNPIADYRVEQNADKTQTIVKVTGKTIGNTVISVTVSANGVEELVTIPITIYDGNEIASGGKEYPYSFSGTMNALMNVVEIDSFSKMMAGSPDEVRPNNGKTLPWKYEFSLASAFYVPSGEQDKYGVCMGTGVGAAAGIRIRLPASGIFTPIVPYKAGTQCPTFRTYIAPADAEDPMADEYSVGTWDAFSKVTMNDQRAYFRSLYLEAGEYIVSWKILKEDPDILASVKGKSRMWYSGIILKAMDNYPVINIAPSEVLPTIKLGNSASVKLSATVADGALEDFIGAEFKVDEAYADKVLANTVINADGTANLEVTGLAVGNYDVGMTLMLNGVERAKFSIPVNVVEPGKLESIQPKLAENDDNTIIRRSTAESLGHVAFIMKDDEGDEISKLSATLQNATYTYTSSNEAIAKVDENGVITPISDGEVKISCSVTIKGITKHGEMILKVVPGKARRSFFTEEKVEAARENASKYAWARKTVVAAENAAKKYLDKEEFLWNVVTTNELPRSYYVGYRADPMSGTCRYCGVNIESMTGSTHPYTVDPINSPWKVQCPACRRKFPSNDFGSFYQLGIKENGKWSYELAKAKNQELVEMGHGGYLVNKDHTEKGAGWGVDDGYGYDTGELTSNNIKEVHTYISYYNHWAIWHAVGITYTALEALKNAYVYTGDAKYGRVGAILLDRIADVYPEQDTRPYRWQLTANANYAPHGKSVDLIWENQLARDYCKAYDAFYPMYNDPQVIDFLSKKAKRYGMENPKTTANLIRENIEDGIVRETYKAAYNGAINGNFGMTQSAVAAAAVVLDTMPETREWLDWVFQDGEEIILYPESKQADLVTGGNVMREIIDSVDRDGVADEVAPNYANIWIGGMNTLLEAVEGYDGYPSSNLYNNARFVKMLSGMHPLTMSRHSTVQIGDSGAAGGSDRLVSPSRAQPAWKYTRKPEFAQMLYFINGNTTKDLHYDIFTRNPESLADEVQQVIDTYGEYDFDKSEMLTGYGLASLRDGTSKTSVNGEVDTQSTYWMSFARYAGHGHYDKLNLGIEAYGANIAPELGYPQKVIDDIYYNWGKATVAHNTVVVDDSHQSGIRKVANPLHFDDSGMVKVMDVEANNEYGAKAEKYRRSVVTVNINEESNYAVDFFRVKGGSEHVYSFHAMSTVKPEIGVNGGNVITPIPQKDGNAYIGTYAGRNILFETANVSSGYSYLKNVDRAANPGKEVYVDFKIDNMRKQLSADRDVYLKLTMLNNFNLSELALAEGEPAKANGNPSHLEFMLARRSAKAGESLDSLFTTVIEPYDKTSNIAKMEQVPVALADGSVVETADVKAVRVELANGRVDYIVYAENNACEYLVGYNSADGSYKFKFQGFVGVYSEQDGKNIYNYINDGTQIGTLSAENALTGTVSSFTEDLTDENVISVDFTGDEEVDLASLAGRYIYIEGGIDGNAAYEIIGASDEDQDGIVDLDIGDVTLIESLKSAEGGVYTYNHNIAKTAKFSIPLSKMTDNSPIITPISDSAATAGKKFTKTILAVSPIDKEITFEAVSLPRGATLDGQTGEITWTPDEKQIGKNIIVVRATDGALASTIYITVDVVRSAGSVSDDNGASGNTGSSDSGNTGAGTQTGGNTGGGAGAGGGAAGGGSSSGGGAAGGGSSSGGGAAGGGSGSAPSGGNDSSDDTAEDKTPTEEDEGTVEVADRFIDLAGYDWAKDAINNLAAKGIINGTSADTYAPGRDITRADFAVLLVRAFGLESDSSENFADVPANAYYAKNLAIAKAHGIINGVGDNKYNPTATITRQDMMTIVSRALDKLGYEIKSADSSDLAGYADAANVTDYASEHVARLIVNEIIKGSGGLINPKSNTTRAEVAVIMERLINLKK